MFIHLNTHSIYSKMNGLLSLNDLIKLCKKKRIGPARAEDNRTLFYKKDISLLARNGFDFETSRKVMDIEKDEYLKIINLL